jgi:hypothetical protein
MDKDWVLNYSVIPRMQINKVFLKAHSVETITTLKPLTWELTNFFEEEDPSGVRRRNFLNTPCIDIARITDKEVTYFSYLHTDDHINLVKYILCPMYFY